MRDTSMLGTLDSCRLCVDAWSYSIIAMIALIRVPRGHSHHWSRESPRLRPFRARTAKDDCESEWEREGMKMCRQKPAYTPTRGQVHARQSINSREGIQRKPARGNRVSRTSECGGQPGGMGRAVAQTETDACCESRQRQTNETMGE
jgi:hypothetical protein